MLRDPAIQSERLLQVEELLQALCDDLIVRGQECHGRIQEARAEGWQCAAREQTLQAATRMLDAASLQFHADASGLLSLHTLDATVAEQLIEAQESVDLTRNSTQLVAPPLSRGDSTSSTRSANGTGTAVASTAAAVPVAQQQQQQLLARWSPWACLPAPSPTPCPSCSARCPV